MGEPNTAWLKTLFWAIVVWNIIYIGFLMAYNVVVPLNLVFTFTYLPIANVPYYTTDTTFPQQMERYNVDFWLYATDFLRWLPPFTISSAMTSAIVFGEKSYHEFNLAFIIILGVIELIKLAYRAAEWGTCGIYGQVCRPFNPATPTGTFGETNEIFKWTVYFNVGMLGALIIFLIFSLNIGASAKSYWKKKTEIFTTAGKPLMSSQYGVQLLARKLKKVLSVSMRLAERENEMLQNQINN